MVTNLCITTLVLVLQNSQTLKKTQGIERVPSFSDQGYTVSERGVF